MKLLQRQIYREISFHLLIGILAINTLIMVEKLIRVSKVLSGIAGPLDMARIIILIQPNVLLITIPVAFLIAILLVFGRLSMDNELIAIASCGISFKRLSGTVLVAGAGLLAFTLIVSTVVAPYGNKRLRKEINGLLKKGITKKIEEKTFTDLGELVIYAEQKEEETLKNIFIYLKEKKGVLTAKKGTIRAEDSGIVIELEDGLINIVREDKRTDIYFGRYTFHGMFPVAGLSRKPGELMPHQLLEEAKKAERKKALSYMSEFYRRFTYPLFNLVIALMGPGLSLLAGRTGRFGGLAVGILFFLAYYMLSIYLEGLVEAEKLDPLTGNLLPVVLGLIAGSVVYKIGSKR